MEGASWHPKSRQKDQNQLIFSNDKMELKSTESKIMFSTYVRGWENFIIALAYLFCLALPGSCLAMFCITLFCALSAVMQMWLIGHNF